MGSTYPSDCAANCWKSVSSRVLGAGCVTRCRLLAVLSAGALGCSGGWICDGGAAVGGDGTPDCAGLVPVLALDGPVPVCGIAAAVTQHRNRRIEESRTQHRARKRKILATLV